MAEPEENFEQEEQEFVEKYRAQGKGLKVGQCKDIVDENGMKIKVCRVKEDPNGIEIFGQIA